MKRKILTYLLLLITIIPSTRAGTIADTLYLESRGEGERGLRAVATVIYNRAKGNPDKFESVCLKPKQFSCWNKSKSVKITPKNPCDAKAYKLCLRIESELLNGKFKPLGNWTHYYNAKLCAPKWAQGTDKITIGRHTFLKTK